MRPLKPLATLNLSLLAAGFLFLSPQIFAMEQAPSASPAPIRVDGTNVWFDIRQFGVEGRGWNDTKDFYDRLPARAEGLVRKPVWDLSHDSAGMCVRFVTDATTIRARWAVTDPWLYLPNTTAIGKSGLDLYVKTENGWHWLAVGQPTAQTNEVTLIKDLIPGKREYLLYLPLYNGTSLSKLRRGVQAIASRSSFTAPPFCRGFPRRAPAWFTAPFSAGNSIIRPSISVFPAMAKWSPKWPTCSPNWIPRFMSLTACPTWSPTKSRHASSRL
jgi:hypothetical protein